MPRSAFPKEPNRVPPNPTCPKCGKRMLLDTKAAAKRAATRGKTRAVAARRKLSPRSGASRWLAFVEEHGVVLASARGPVPSVASSSA